LSGTPPLPIESAPGGVRLHLLIQPRASVSEIVGLHAGRIKIRLAAPPVDGAANKALLKFLAKALKVSPTAVVIASGATGRRKAVTVGGVSIDQTRNSLLPNIR
jgi:uncharacterized protein (TIGR00251 family)